MRRDELPIDQLPATIFLDLDGTVFKHSGTVLNLSLIKSEMQLDDFGVLLPGVKEKWLEWLKANHNIIITTGRKESLREYTIKQLDFHGLCYDQLIMGIGRGQRYLINDAKPEQIFCETAIAFTLRRNEGLSNVELDPK